MYVFKALVALTDYFETHFPKAKTSEIAFSTSFFNKLLLLPALTYEA